MSNIYGNTPEDRHFESQLDEYLSEQEQNYLHELSVRERYTALPDQLAADFPGDHSLLLAEVFNAMHSYHTGLLDAQQLADRLTNIHGAAIDQTVEFYV